MAEEDDCGCGGKIQTRREFFQTTAVVSIGIAATAMLTTSELLAKASNDGDTLGQYLHFCETQFDLCMSTAAKDKNFVTRKLKEVACHAQLQACVVAAMITITAGAMQSAKAWLQQHAGEIAVGTIVVIAGVAFIVLTDGAGGLIIAFA